MKQRISLFIFLLYAAVVTAGAQNSPATVPCADSLHVFRFVAANDMFYIPYKGNDRELARLTEMIEAYCDDILAGRLPVLVDGWCTSHPDRETNLRTAATRSNRVKSELICRKGLTEDNFVTQNHAEAYNAPDGKSYRDMVVVTLRIPAKTEATATREAAGRAEAERLAAEQAERDRLASKQAAREREEAQRLAAEQERMAAEEAARRTQDEPKPAAPEKAYCVAVRTNLLYDAFLLPTLGVEWRVNRDWSVKLDGSLSWWGSNSDKVQKIWLLNPEVRWYLLRDRRFYVGASGSYGEYNIYKYPLGSLLSKDTGYQGTLWSAGVTVGYQLCLSRYFSVDFNLGLGYTRSKYDSFGMTDGVRVSKERDKSKNFFGPTQAGISLVWTFGNNK